MSSKSIRRVAVLGAGTMGARIAAHFANANVPVLLLDLTPEAAAAGIKAAVSGFYVASNQRLVTTGSFDADLPKIADCDWVLEAVTEDLAIKRALYDRVIGHRKPGSIVSTNTSGIPLRQIAEGRGDEFREHFCGIHFFNPPRYLHLVEMIPGPATSPEVLETVAAFCDLRLGKGVVRCKDTPNFIANRIGGFFGATVQKLTVEQDLTIEEVDVLTGQLIGLPKSASYRLLDIVGLDVWAHVTRNLAGAVPRDPYRERFVMVPFLTQMIERGWLGDKRGQGCYKRVGKEREIYAIDWKTLEYHPAAKPRFDIPGTLPERLKALMAGKDKAGKFVFELLSDHMLYAAWMVPEISDSLVEIDRAMKWGYAHAMGPFELWDTLGFIETANRMEAAGKTLPPMVTKMLTEGATSFYGTVDVPPRPGIVILSQTNIVVKNAGASLLDLGDGVLCCEFHGKMNTIGDDAGAMLRKGVVELESNFVAMVIGNQGDNFSAGANLMQVLLTAQEAEWDELDAAIRRFQQTNMLLKYAVKPVVAAPFGIAFGGGCEVPLHCARVQASAELYTGLVEFGVGLIPAGGGCKEMVIRTPEIRKAFELIGYGKSSTSAAEALEMGFLRDVDGISMNPERLIDDAKRLALSIAPGYSPGAPKSDIAVGGEEACASMKLGLWMAGQGGYASEHDALIGGKLAHILSGGKKRGTVTEQQLLDLEREAFLSLCGTRKTRDRIAHMLKTGKALRN